MAPIAARPIKSGDIWYYETQQGHPFGLIPTCTPRFSLYFVLSSFVSERTYGRGFFFKSLTCQLKETPTSTDEIIMKITTECSGILGVEWARVTSRGIKSDNRGLNYRSGYRGFWLSVRLLFSSGTQSVECLARDSRSTRRNRPYAHTASVGLQSAAWPNKNPFRAEKLQGKAFLLLPSCVCEALRSLSGDFVQTRIWRSASLLWCDVLTAT